VDEADIHTVLVRESFVNDVADSSKTATAFLGLLEEYLATLP
jgi:hypothetical protein